VVARALSLAVAAVFAIAAGSKTRNIVALENYLRPVSGGHGRILTRAVLVAECGLAAICLVAAADRSFSGVAGVAVTAFTAIASSVYAALLAAGDSAECHCFGTRRQASGESESNAVKPAIVAGRNVALTVCSLSLAGLPIIDSLAIATIVVVAIGGGLVRSIMVERRRLGTVDSTRVRRLAAQLGRLEAQTWWLDGKPRSL
jgi:hypothetical protein